MILLMMLLLILLDWKALLWRTPFECTVLLFISAHTFVHWSWRTRWFLLKLGKDSTVSFVQAGSNLESTVREWSCLSWWGRVRSFAVLSKSEQNLRILPERRLNLWFKDMFLYSIFAFEIFSTAVVSIRTLFLCKYTQYDWWKRFESKYFSMSNINICAQYSEFSMCFYMYVCRYIYIMSLVVSNLLYYIPVMAQIFSIWQSNR